MEIRYETSCVGINPDQFDELMHNMKPCSYQALIRLIKKYEPEFYEDQALHLMNPWADQCGQTETHFMLIHSGIEYFFSKVGQTHQTYDDTPTTKTVTVRYSFDVEYHVLAESDCHAEELVLSHCGLVIGGDIHSTLPDDQINWNANVHPKREIVYS